jgi:hypothetical protein
MSEVNRRFCNLAGYGSRFDLWMSIPMLLFCMVQQRALPQALSDTIHFSTRVAARRNAFLQGVRTVKSMAAVERIEVYPATVQLDSRRAYRQFVVTGYFHGIAHDVTTEAEYRVSNAHVATLHGSRVDAAGDGRAVVTVGYGGRTAQIPVSVAHTAAPDPISFKFETRAVLTKQGCATGSCHGSPHGKGGFSLSLFGYDPTIDRISLTHDGYNRRVNVMEPAESLMLKKPLLEIPHVGGKRLHKNDAAYRIFTDWIYQGAHTDLPSVDCDRIAITPGAGRVLHAPFLRQQLSVLAHFTDGTARDVSRIAAYDTTNPAVATVDADGLITAHGRGQAAISVRYLDKFESVSITVVEDIPGFRWNHPPENNRIDQLVDARLLLLQYLPSETCSDSVFLRRLSLDLTGLLPTADQTRRFLADRSPDKRARLIDALLETDEYAHFWALKIADLMRVSPTRLPEGRADLFAQWLVEAVRNNMPYDRFAHAILTSEGDTKQVPAANYFLAIPTMEERTEMTAQLFMGTRIECTKCHNHPFENWTMRDYYSIAAVFARTRDEDGEITLASTGEALHPTTKEVMKPWGATEEQHKAAEDRRVAFVDWLTKPGNPFFARVEVNRIWANLMGRGIVEPVDDFRSSNPPANAPLLDALAQEFERSGYDRKRIIRLICNSRTYQRSSMPNRFNQTDESLFSHAKIRLLTAEQLQDAMGIATRLLPPATTIDTRLAELHRQIAARNTAMEANYPAWTEAKAVEVARLPFRLGDWYVAVPGKALSVREGIAQSFPLETEPIDLAKGWSEVRPFWQRHPDFNDGARHGLTQGRNLVQYLYRWIYTMQARTVTAQLAAGESWLVRLNGQSITAQPQRGQQKITLKLQPGDNALLIKTVSGGPRTSFRFQLSDADIEAQTKTGLTAHEVELLSVTAARRSILQQQWLHRSYLEQDGEARGLQQRITHLASRLDYATQRPYPQGTQFAATFGQPKRDTACTCERQHSPTLLQALELLNGDTAYRLAQDSVPRYAPYDNGKLVEELYLSALCRLPTAKESAAAQQYLAGNADRNRAAMDLIWTVMNTQEFLFQH